MGGTLAGCAALSQIVMKARAYGGDIYVESMYAFVLQNWIDAKRLVESMQSKNASAPMGAALKRDRGNSS